MKTINGWTKKSMIAHIKKNFKGKSFIQTPDGYSPNDITCLYRGPNGKKCAVGMFIPNKLYSKTIEGGAFSDIEPKRLSKISQYMPLEDMDELQRVHDNRNYYKKSEVLKHMLDWIETNVE